MRMLRSWIILVGAFASLCSAQLASFLPCKAEAATELGHRDGITIRRVKILEPTGEISATVLVPQSNTPVPAIVFSHSEIVGPSGSGDLRQFAWVLARAGSASIILDGTIDWQVSNDDSERSPHVMACAGQWLLLHASLDLQRLGLAGPDRLWGGGDTPHCMTGETPCWRGRVWLNFGQTSPAEFRNTERMLTREGQQEMAEFAVRVLSLKELRPEWFLSAPDDLLGKRDLPTPSASQISDAQPRLD